MKSNNKRKKKEDKKKKRMTKAQSQWTVYDPIGKQASGYKGKNPYRAPRIYKYKENNKTVLLYEQEKESLDRLQKEIQIRNMKSSNLDINKKGGR